MLMGLFRRPQKATTPEGAEVDVPETVPVVAAKPANNDEDAQRHAAE
jgi:hypothetical protein